jgi:hypothetical protein
VSERGNKGIDKANGILASAREKSGKLKREWEQMQNLARGMDETSRQAQTDKKGKMIVKGWISGERNMDGWNSDLDVYLWTICISLVVVMDFVCVCLYLYELLCVNGEETNVIFRCVIWPC